MFESYAISSDFISQRLHHVTHSFSALSTEDNHSLLPCRLLKFTRSQRPASWFHFLCKNITISESPGSHNQVQDLRGTSLSHADWTWVRSSFHLTWEEPKSFDRSTVTLIVFSPSFELRERFNRMLCDDLAEVLVDPFSLYVIILDELFAQADAILWSVSNVFGPMERVS